MLTRCKASTIVKKYNLRVTRMRVESIASDHGRLFPTSYYEEHVNSSNKKGLSKRRKSKKIDAATKRRKLETNPLKIDNIVENVLSYLDVNALKSARQVSKLWSVEGAKLLISKWHVQVPHELPGASSKLRKVLQNKFKAFILHKSSALKIPNVMVNGYGDIDLLKSLGVPVEQVSSLKLNFLDLNDGSNWFENILDPLLNLSYFKIHEYILCKPFAQNNTEIIKTLTKVLSKIHDSQNTRKPVVVSRIDLYADCLEELEDLEKFADCSNIQIEHLLVAINCDLLKDDNVPNLEARLANIFSKLFTNNKSILKELALNFCEDYLVFIEFPCMTALTRMSLKSEANPAQRAHHKFFPTFRFSEHLPNLQDIVINSERYGEHPVAQDFFANLFENTTGLAPSVKRVCYSDQFSYCNLDPLLQKFPNMELFEMHDARCSQNNLKSLWTYGKNLKNLSVILDPDQFIEEEEDLDFIFTGFSAETIEMLQNRRILPRYSLEELENLRINPSILNLKELKNLTIHFNDGDKELPRRMMAIVGEYSFKQMNSKICIRFEDNSDRIECAKKALKLVSKLSNVTMEFEEDNDYSEPSDSDSDYFADSD